jgi:hypothetical protein
MHRVFVINTRDAGVADPIFFRLYAACRETQKRRLKELPKKCTPYTGHGYA